MHLYKKLTRFKKKLLTIWFWLSSNTKSHCSFGAHVCLVFLLRNHFSSFTFLLCLGNQINVVCLGWVLFWLSCCGSSSLNNSRNPSKWGEALFLASLLDPSGSHISSPFICPLFPFSFCDSNYPLAKKHPTILLSPSAIYKEQSVAFALINIYVRLRQTRSNVVRLSCERLIYMCFFHRSHSPLFLWKMLNSPTLVQWA